MLQDLIDKGLKYSKNPIFRTILGRASGIMAKPVKIAMLLTTAYGKLVNLDSSRSGIDQVKDFMQTFIRLVKSYSNGSYRNVSNKSLLIGVGVLIYLVTPIDIIPDFIPIVGFLDDISLMAWFIDAFQKEISNFKEWEAGNAIQPTIGTL
jgi:uncharacterized membrane protein YkvA (DUF1232 family)